MELETDNESPLSSGKQVLKVVHVSRADARCGASRAAYRLHSGLGKHNIDSRMFVLDHGADDAEVKVFAPPTDTFSRLKRLISRTEIEYDRWRNCSNRPIRASVFRDDRSKFGASLLAQLPPCDILTLHEISWFVDYRKFLPSASRIAPIVWYLTEMLPLTGGCQYAMGCEGFLKHCGTCPQLASHHKGDLSHQIWKRKAAAYRSIPKNRLHFVANSKWLAEEAQRSSLTAGFPVTTIPYSMNVDDFAPRNREFARSVLGIPQDASVLLFVASDIGSWLKGFDVLAEAVVRLGEVSKLWVVSAGGGTPGVALPCRQLSLGEVQDDRLLSLVYSSADLFIAPSRAEAFGQTVLESLACGTPVIGSAIGGILDTVRPGVTGELVPPGDSEALSAAIERLLENYEQRVVMGKQGRQIVLQEYSAALQVKRFSELYAKILEKASN